MKIEYSGRFFTLSWLFTKMPPRGKPTEFAQNFDKISYQNFDETFLLVQLRSTIIV